MAVEGVPFGPYSLPNAPGKQGLAGSPAPI